MCLRENLTFVYAYFVNIIGADALIIGSLLYVGKVFTKMDEEPHKVSLTVNESKKETSCFGEEGVLRHVQLSMFQYFYYEIMSTFQ